MTLLLQKERLHTESLHFLLKAGYQVTAKDFASASGHTLGDVILQQQGKLPMLSQICCIQIRKHFGSYYDVWQGLLRALSLLPLPSTLMESLLLEELDDAVVSYLPQIHNYVMQ